MSTTAAGAKPYLVYLIAMVAALGGFLFGYDLSIISGAMIFITEEFALSPGAQGFAVGSALLGCMAGPVLGGTLSDRWGRKRTLIFAGLLFAVGAVGTAMPATITQFNALRFLGGVGVGLASVVSPMFIAEMSPPRIRGALVTINQLAVVVGLAVAVVVSYFLSFGDHWRWMLASNAAPVPLFLVGLLLMPESPRWLVQQRRDGEALRTLTLIDGRASAEGEMRAIAETVGTDGRWRELVQPGTRYALGIACALAIFQQITGASILTMYMPIIFQDAGFFDPSDAILQNVIMSAWYIVCTVAALLVVDRIGRRPLLLVGTAGMALGMMLLGGLFHARATGMYVVLTMFLVMGAYLISLAPLVWLIMSEIFPNRLRGKAMAVASVFVWTASFLTANYFPPLVDHFKNAYGTPAMAFCLYAIVSAVAFIFIWCVVPETKGRTLEELGNLWSEQQ